MIIDTHVHPLAAAADRDRYPFSPGEPEAPDWYSEVPATGEQILGHMSQAGVDRVVFVSSFNAYGYDSRYAADVADGHRDRAVGVCRIDGEALDAPDVLSYWVEQRGMRGVRLGSAAPENYPVCERARQLGIPVALQVPPTEVGQVRRLAERFPELRVILDHLAHPPIQSGPPYAEAREFFNLAEVPHLYLKFSTLNLNEAQQGRSTTRAFLEGLIAGFGPARLMWGSDFPHSRGSSAAPYRELVDLMHESLAFLPAREQEQLVAGTALALYPTLAGAGA